jgi:hypothetical protein
MQLPFVAAREIRFDNGASRPQGPRTKKKAAPGRSGLKFVRRGCLKGRLFFALQQILCKCEEMV